MLSPLPSTAVYVPGKRGHHTDGKGVITSSGAIVIRLGHQNKLLSIELQNKDY